MRSPYLEFDYWPAMCARTFEGLDMSFLPNAKETVIQQSGLNNRSTNTFFTNGVEDPWKWATVRHDTIENNLIARTSDCNDCGHCVEMYTPTPDDPIEVQATRAEIRTWIADIIGPETYNSTT